MRKIYLSFAVIAIMIIFAACKNDAIIENGDFLNETNFKQREPMNPEELAQLDKYELKKDFAIALHRAMSDNVEVRVFLKKEAMKKFDGDFDVLYNYVKCDELAGRKFRDWLVPYFESENRLTEIEEQIPALTIFVPSLPEDSFSAEKWEVEKDVPMVAIRMFSCNDVPLITGNPDECFLLDGNVIPGFPVIVLKENETVMLPQYAGYESFEGEELVSVCGFRFKKPFGPKGNGDPVLTGDEIIDAWNILGDTYDYWQRDYIYYGITPQNTSGAFKDKYIEAMTTFRMLGTGEQALSILTPSHANDYTTVGKDPELKPINEIILFGNTPPEFSAAQLWTGGNFVFDVNCDFMNGITLYKQFPLAPEQLFDIQYQKIVYKFSVLGIVIHEFVLYIPVSVTTKVAEIDVRFVSWRLQDYSNKWKIAMFESDYGTTAQYTVKGTTSKNTNFSTTVNSGYGDVKIGTTTGGSTVITDDYTTTYTVSIVSDKLGEAIVEFGDRVIKSQSSTPPYYNFYKYQGGNYEFTMRPVIKYD